MTPAHNSSTRPYAMPGLLPLRTTTSQPWTLLIPLLLAITIISLLLLTYRTIKRDYEAFLSLGPGGTPYTFRGYTQLSLLKLLRIRNPYIPPRLSDRLRPERGFLHSLPTRAGPRPQLIGVAPQRQLTQRPSPGMIQAVHATMCALASECPTHWFVARSAFEKHGDALFARYKTFNEPDYYGEIVHVHNRDGSMHLTLHAEDVRVVLEAGWGERHPLARGRTWWWHAPLPRGFVMLYAPRDGGEVRVVEEIMRAAAWWVSGVGRRRGEEKVSSMEVKVMD